MQGDLNQSQEIAVLSLIAKITSITDFNVLLNTIVQDVPSVLGAVGCWIYLRPDFVPQYNGVLFREEKEIIDLDISQEYIVLAATNLDSKKPLIGKAFFRSGEGITGWVYKNGKTLRIGDLANAVELKSISNEIDKGDEYREGDELYEPHVKRPLLAVPLILDDRSFGVLKFHATIDKQQFTRVSEEIAFIVSQIIAGAIRQTWIVTEQNQTISRLIETSNRKSAKEVIVDVTRSMKEILNYSRVEYYMQNETNNLYLAVRNGEHVSDNVEFTRGQGLVGWVFKTGHPLFIDDIKQFSNKILLNDELLEKISNTREINDEDRFIELTEGVSSQFPHIKTQGISFLAVPVISKEKDIVGVLCGYRSRSINVKPLYEHSQVMLASSFAGTISLALENERQRNQSDLLIELGQLSDYQSLLKLTTDKLPQLVSASGCSIFEVFTESGNIELRLTYTNRKEITSGKGVPEISYQLGEGRTGIAALTQATLVINHYGIGEATGKKLLREINTLKSMYPYDLIQLVRDSDKNEVGFIQLRNGLSLPPSQQTLIEDFSKGIVFQKQGVLSSKLTQYTEVIPLSTWSYIAVPLFSEHKLIGVITLNRSVPELPFSSWDIALLESIAGRLESVLNTLSIAEQRKQLTMSLAHEINTPLTGILADSENIYQEAPENTNLKKIAKHNLEQVLRLHMQASTLLSVLAEQQFVREISENNLIKPLKEACELFETEASQKGCSILLEGEFPSIEMSLFDLTIAFKNIVHNAVKYSFSPSPELNKYRNIRIWGQWENDRKEMYAIYIQNYGIGILQEEIERRLIFAPYYRGVKSYERRRTGAGLGLAHARQVIEDLHHGLINVTCINLGENAFLTTFIIKLPVKQPS